MTVTRRTCALVALILMLVLGACSTPNDLTPPVLEPQFGGAYNDYGIDVAVSSSGPVYLLSWEEEGYDDGDGYINVYGDSYLSRYDNVGNLVWKLDVSEVAGDYSQYPAKSVFTGSQGYVYVISNTEDWDGNEFDYINAFDSSGRLVESYSYCYSSIDATVDSSGNVIVACYNSVSKYSPAGSLLWQRTVTVGTPSAITVSGSNIYVVGPRGVSRLASSNGNIAWTKTGAGQDIAASGSNVYVRNLNVVRKLDSNGRQLWSKSQSGLNSMVFADMALDTNGNVYLTGKYSVNSPNRNAFTRKLNASGTTLWTKTFGTTAYEDARSVSTVTGAAVYVTGATQGSLAHPYRGGENDGYITKLGSTGTPIWTR